jgi:hypothetical protein
MRYGMSSGRLFNKARMKGAHKRVEIWRKKDYSQCVRVRCCWKSSSSRRRINEIVLGKWSITADTALRLARFFDMSPQFWLGLQMDYNLDVAEDALAERLAREVIPYAAIS